MVMMRCVRYLLSLPFAWFGQLAALLRLPLGVPLLKMAWLVGRDGEIAALALARMQKTVGPEAALAQAQQWMARQPQTEIACLAGMCALSLKDVALARACLARAKELGPDRGGLLEVLEFAAAASDPDIEVMGEAALRLATRTDLSPVVSNFVHHRLLWDALMDGRFEEVERRARHLGTIDYDPSVATAFWVLARRAGSHASLDEFLRRKKLVPVERIVCEIMGHLGLGEIAAARALEPQLQELDPVMAARIRQRIEKKEAAAWTR